MAVKYLVKVVQVDLNPGCTPPSEEQLKAPSVRIPNTVHESHPHAPVEFFTGIDDIEFTICQVVRWRLPRCEDRQIGVVCPPVTGHAVSGAVPFVAPDLLCRLADSLLNRFDRDLGAWVEQRRALLEGQVPRIAGCSAAEVAVLAVVAAVVVVPSPSPVPHPDRTTTTATTAAPTALLFPTARTTPRLRTRFPVITSLVPMGEFCRSTRQNEGKLPLLPPAQTGQQAAAAAYIPVTPAGREPFTPQRRPSLCSMHNRKREVRHIRR